MMNRLLFLTGLAFLPFLGACGPKYTGPETQFVEGIVTLDGTPLEKVSLQMIPLREGEGAAGQSGAKGHYMLSSVRGLPGRGAVAGEYKVLAMCLETYELPKPFRAESGELVTHGYRQSLPEIYQSLDKTPLVISVVKGKNNIPIELKSKP